MKRYLFGITAILLVVTLSACQAASTEPDVIVITSVVTVEVVVTATSEPAVLRDSTPTPDLPIVTAVVGDWLLPEDAINHIGEVVAVRLDKVYCSFQSRSNGTPTFCNDQPYPEHNFTFVVWGEDWSGYDGACVIVEGEIEEYDGKAQIEVDEEIQVQYCP